jgi:endonuclease/exonuclease/phosphatase (EEP) superfamily protein YafD
MRSTPPSSFLSPQVRLRGMIDVVATLCLFATFAGWLGRWYWLLDLCDHFRLQCTVVSLASVVWFVGSQRKWLTVLSVAVAAANAYPILRTTWVAGPAPGSPWSLDVCCFNVLASNPQKEPVIRYLREQAPEVIVLLEVDQAWANALTGLEDVYPHRLIHPRDDNFGIALLSRHPLTEPTIHHLGGLQVPIITATIQHDGRSFLLVGAHLIPPMRSDLAIESRKEALELGDFLAKHQDRPLLVAGDFNASPWSQTVNLLRKRGGVDFRQPGPAWWPTWNTRSVLMLPIDHAFCSAPLLIVQRTVGPHLGSDHRPQMLTLGWSLEPPEESVNPREKPRS